MKKFLLLFSLVTIVINIQAQRLLQLTQGLGIGGQQTIVGINAEQIVNKIGEEKLMKLLSDKRDKMDKGDADRVKQNAIQKRAIAALYGAGIDFSRKIWSVPNTIYTKAISTYGDYSGANNVTIILGKWYQKDSKKDH
jgi:hypothetical protein